MTAHLHYSFDERRIRHKSGLIFVFSELVSNIYLYKQFRLILLCSGYCSRNVTVIMALEDTSTWLHPHANTDNMIPPNEAIKPPSTYGAFPLDEAIVKSIILEIMSI